MSPPSNWTSEEAEAGPRLDRLIELRVFGRKPLGEVPPYSTDEETAERVIAQLTRPPLRWMSLQDGDDWIFQWRQPMTTDPDSTASRYEKFVSGRASTRALAICRAALKLVGSSRPDGSTRGDSARV